MALDNSRVSAKLAEVRKQLAENAEARLHEDENSSYNLDLQIQSGFLSGQQSVLQQVQEGHFDVRQTGSGDTEHPARPGRARKGS